ncbi:MAG: hypothetical protein OXG37_16615 [Actinomycetia bacterium]|nr:hypothetical protein [Actinomycetes bacterium]
MSENAEGQSDQVILSRGDRVEYPGSYQARFTRRLVWFKEDDIIEDDDEYVLTASTKPREANGH